MQRVDSLLLDERMEGDYRVQRYRVEQSDEADYTVRYRINLSKLNQKLGDNAAQLQELEHFFSTLTGDTLRKVQLISITGYASPDGPQAFNDRLARARTTDFTRYGDQKYHFSDRYRLETRSVAEDWEGLRHSVQHSSMPNREAVLKILDGTASHEEKERQLKEMPAAWEYLKTDILPELRRVEVVINYAQGAIVTHRTLAVSPRPAPRELSRVDPCDPCACDLVDEEITGIIIAYPEELQHPERQARHEGRRKEGSRRRR